MDPPPSQPTTILHQHYQDSLEPSSVSSPTTRQWDETLPPPKLRMMCSYGGHIIPRPHDKSLCYMGGETRIVVADRHTSLEDLCSRLSTTLLHGRQFSLKYQLPSEDLDSLVSLTTEEDLENMLEEYDRLNSSNPITNKPLRLRLFLFLSKPETAASMGSLLDDAKSETWFVDALNGAGLLPRGFSDNASIDNLLEHKDGAIQEGVDNNMINYTDELETQQRRLLDVQLNLPDSPLVETSSFGSSSSSPGMSNLPPIKVRMMDQMNQMAGLDQQFSQLNVPGDEERSDHGAPSGGVGGGMRKPPLPLQPVQRKFAQDAYNLPSPDSSKHGLHSPDSITSDTSNVSASKPTFTQDPNPQSNRDTATPPMTTQFYPTTTTNYQIPIQQIPESGDASPQLNRENYHHQQHHHQQPQQPQQFYQTRPNYIQHPTTNQPPQPVQSYYQVYTPTQQMDHQQYPLYFLPVSQNHPYGMQLQSNQSDAVTTNPSSNASSTTASPLYPTKNAIPLSKSDMVTNSLYTTATPGMIPVPSNQFQQYMNASQIPHHPPTPMPTSNGGQYGYEYANPTQDQVYYSQHHSVAAPPPSQYQTMTPSSAMLLAQVPSAQQPAPESVKQ